MKPIRPTCLLPGPFSPRGIEQSLVLPPRWPLILYTGTLYSDRVVTVVNCQQHGYYTLDQLCSHPGRGTQPFFFFRYVAWISEVWGLWTDFSLWKRGLMNWNFQIWWLFGQNFQFFSQKGVLGTDKLFCLKWDPCKLQEAWKGALQGRTSPYPLSRSVAPQGSHDAAGS